MPTWHNPITWAYGQLITTDNLNDQLRDNLKFLHEPAFAHVYNNAAITLIHNVSQAVTFNTNIRVTPSSMHSISSNTSRLVAPYTGYYHIQAQAEFGGSATGRRLLEIKKNGAAPAIASIERGGLGSTNESMEVNTLVELTQDDYIELWALQNSGGNLNLTGTPFAPSFMMIHLGAF